MSRRVVFHFAMTGAFAAAFLSVFFFAKMRERAAYINDLVRSAVGDVDRTDPSQAAVALSRAIYQRTNRTVRPDELDRFSRWESLSLFNVTSAVSLRYGVYGIEGHSVEGACGTMSRLLLNSLWTLDIPARKLQLLDNAQGLGGGHTLVEFYDGGRWRVISPSDSSFVWRAANGEIATAEDIKNDPALYASVYEWKSDYPYRFDNYKNIRWEKLPRSARKMMRMTLGEKRYNSATTPSLYETPRTLFFIASLFVFFVCGAVAAFTKPRSTRT